MWIVLARFFLPAGIDCLMPVPCLQVTGEDLSAVTGEEEQRDGWSSGNKLPFMSHRTKDSLQWRLISSFSIFCSVPQFSSTLFPIPVLRPTISSALGSDVSTEEVQLTYVVNDTSVSYWFFRASVCFSLCLASIFFSLPCLDTVSLSFSLAVKHRFILPVMRGEESSVSAQG